MSRHNFGTSSTQTSDIADITVMDTASETGRRQRSRMACEPCRSRKRKCGGGQPCDLCSGFGYECYYRSTPRKRRGNGRKAGSNPSPHETQPEASTAAQTADESPQQAALFFMRSMESNSGSAFVRTFAMAVDSTTAPPFQPLAWNLFLGERQVVPHSLPRSITHLLSLREMQNLATVYFDKVDPCYGFIERNTVDEAIRQRWLPGGECTLYDAVLCGIAALARVFSSLEDLQTEISLVSLAKSLLDLAVSEEASVCSATAWVLRTAYLRLTAKPDEAWMASCAALHVIDAAGLHCEPDPSTIFRRAGRECNPDIRRRIFGVARHLNLWMSFDLARTRVVLHDASPIPPSAKAGDYTTELLECLPMAESLDPGKSLSGAELMTTFSEVISRAHSEPPSVLSQCNLMLCLYRRLYTLKWKIPDDTLGKAVSLLQRGLRAVRMTVESGSPWHHMANVPFQSICMLLAIDTAQSFSLLIDAMTCLDTVNQAYQTKATSDAVAAARALIFMHQKRREADVRKQSEMLKLYPAAQPTYEETLDNFPFNQAFTDLPWFNDLIPDIDLGTFEQPFAL